jgi:hypothetical protein
VISPEIHEVMLEGVHLYEINPITTRLTIKPEMGKMIIHSKQYADIFGEWMLAFYPQSDNYHMPILVNLNSGKWTDDMHSNFARHSPLVSMTSKLKKLYGDEIRPKPEKSGV